MTGEITDTHLALGLHESRSANLPTRFELWVERVEKMLGHSLDGDQKRDGYSLDEAREMFENRITAPEYARLVRFATNKGVVANRERLSR